MFLNGQRSLHVCVQTPDEKAAFQAVQDAFKQGVNFFDVAPFYAAGKAEEVSITILFAELVL